jgi:hypothetical protein
MWVEICLRPAVGNASVVRSVTTKVMQSRRSDREGGSWRRDVRVERPCINDLSRILSSLKTALDHHALLIIVRPWPKKYYH